ncbi:MAG: low specificity L-threonine aldolase [Lachnospiraceae bacterium]|nr:low specificity L-threonine aldolase [Lachnospiraceae bacterium]
MLNFTSDYTNVAHEKVLERLANANNEMLSGYGTDPYCESAKQKIRKICKCPKAGIYFLTGGTQTNQIVINALLQSYEGVIAADCGHINVHEAGAIEFIGHKVLTLPAHAGKMQSEELRQYLKNFFNDENREHMVYPGMVYLSYPTELGTLYSEEELREIHEICKEYSLKLYLDGARMGYGLAADSNMDFAKIAANCDVFYIGGTKVGALCGEAVVFPKGDEPKAFITRIKQQGALLAKGFILGLQFDTLFTDELYQRISEHAVSMAMKLKEAFRQNGYTLAVESPTNQQFVILSKTQETELAAKVRYSFWERLDDEHIVVRFATSWSTKEEDVDTLIGYLR